MIDYTWIFLPHWCRVESASLPVEIYKFYGAARGLEGLHLSRGLFLLQCFGTYICWCSINLSNTNNWCSSTRYHTVFFFLFVFIYFSYEFSVFMFDCLFIHFIYKLFSFLLIFYLFNECLYTECMTMMKFLGIQRCESL